MTRPGIFGWSYPAGCSGPPEDDYNDDPTALEEEVASLCAKRGLDAAAIGKILEVLAKEELALYAQEAEAMYEAYQEDLLLDNIYWSQLESRG